MNLSKIFYPSSKPGREPKVSLKNGGSNGVTHEGNERTQGIATEISELIKESMEEKKTNLPVRRAEHPKQHGCVWAEFIVEDDLPQEIKVGIFRESKSFPAWIRFSSFQEQDDSKGDLLAFAIKLMGVEGKKALLKEDGKTQDFIMVSHPCFPIKNAEDYLDRQQKKAYLHASKCPIKQISPKLPDLLTWLSFFFPSYEPQKWRLRELSVFTAMALRKLFRKPNSPLEIPYWSMTPYCLGLETAPAMKFFVKPSSDNTLGRSIRKSSNYLREAMAEYLGTRDAYFDFYIQLESDPDKTPIDDPRIEWKGAPEYKVATIRIPAQTFDLPEQMEFGESLSYNPWHALREHKPLGEINLVRKIVYPEAANLRRSSDGWNNQKEPSINTYEPHLLKAQLPHNALTVMVPVEPGKVCQLRELLEETEETIKARLKRYSPSTHFCRWVILEDPDDKNGIQPHLLFTSNYDGVFDSYIREMVKVAEQTPEIEEIWKLCKDYAPGTSSNVGEYKQFIQRYSRENKKPEVFYSAYRHRTVDAIQNSCKIREKVENLIDRKSNDFTVEEVADLLVATAPLPAHSPFKECMLLAYDFLKKSRLDLLAVGLKLGHRDPQKAIRLREKLMFDQDRYRELRRKEDRGCQNELTAFVAIKSNWYSKLLLRGALSFAQYRAKTANGSLSNIFTIHFLRWVIFDLDTIAGEKTSYLLFESNYNGSWDSYIDDFIRNARPMMNLVLGNCIGFPKGGCEDIESFKQHIRTHQFPAQIFYSAYPDRNVKNIRGDLDVCDTAAQLLQKTDRKSFQPDSSTPSVRAAIAEILKVLFVNPFSPE